MGPVGLQRRQGRGNIGHNDNPGFGHIGAHQIIIFYGTCRHRNLGSWIFRNILIAVQIQGIALLNGDGLPNGELRIGEAHFLGTVRSDEHARGDHVVALGVQSGNQGTEFRELSPHFINAQFF